VLKLLGLFNGVGSWNELAAGLMATTLILRETLLLLRIVLDPSSARYTMLCRFATLLPTMARAWGV
jgi:IS5 family transposase